MNTAANSSKGVKLRSLESKKREQKEFKLWFESLLNEVGRKKNDK